MSMNQDTQHEIKQEILTMSRVAHEMTERAYQQHSAVRGEPAWADKQRILLADMALHLLQTALHDGARSEAQSEPQFEAHLKRNLYAILTISDQFVADQDLKAAADALLLVAPQ